MLDFNAATLQAAMENNMRQQFVFLAHW